MTNVLNLSVFQHSRHFDSSRDDVCKIKIISVNIKQVRAKLARKLFKYFECWKTQIQNIWYPGYSIYVLKFMQIFWYYSRILWCYKMGYFIDEKIDKFFFKQSYILLICVFNVSIAFKKFSLTWWYVLSWLVLVD